MLYATPTAFLSASLNITRSFVRRFDRVVTPCWAGSAISRPSFAGVVTTIETVFLTGGGGDEYYYERTEDLPEHGYDNNTYEPTS